jgi:hypothetical protein
MTNVPAERMRVGAWAAAVAAAEAGDRATLAAWLVEAVVSASRCGAD